MKLDHRLSIFLIILWAATFILFASRINIKSYYEHEATFFAENGYNFEYKQGFPTPWYSRYYVIPAGQVNEYKSSSSDHSIPPDDFMIYKDISYSVLSVQGLLALATPFAVVVIIKGTGIIRRKK